MSPKLAAVDASVIILLTAPPRPDDPTERALRRERASTSMQELRDDGFRFFVPAPAIVELSVHESGERLAERVLARLVLLIPVASRRLPGAAWGPIYRAWM